MKKIAMIGYGQLGKQFEHLILGSFADSTFIYFDDIAVKNGIKSAYPFKSYLENDFKDFEFQIALGYKHLSEKKEIIDNLIDRQRKMHTFIHSSAIVDCTARIDTGTVIYPNVTIDKNVCIGKGCVINLSVTISHDSIVGDFCYLSPSVTLSGFVTIGQKVFLGTGVNVANNVIINSS